MRLLLALLMTSASLSATLGCSDDGSDEPVNPTADAGGLAPGTLDPEPAGAPSEAVDGRWNCLGDNAPAAATGNSLELTGYVRTLADPEATQPTPASKVEVFAADGVSLGTGFADPTKAGRVSVTVPTTSDGFTGYALITMSGFLDYRFASSQAVTTTDFSGWAWLVTQQEVDDRAGTLGVAVESGRGILVGAVHDCDVFGARNAVVTVSSSADGVFYVEGFDLSKDRTSTTATGRFVVPNLPPGEVVVAAYGRLEAGGPLTQLGAAKVTIEAGRISAIDLQPRVGAP